MALPLLVMCEALRRMAEVKMLRTARAELDIQINDFLVHAGAPSVHAAAVAGPGLTGNPKNIPFQQARKRHRHCDGTALPRFCKKNPKTAFRQKPQPVWKEKSILLIRGCSLYAKGRLPRGAPFSSA